MSPDNAVFLLPPPPPLISVSFGLQMAIDTINPTGSTMKASNFASVEVYLALIVSCAPAIKFFISKYMPSWLGSLPGPHETRTMPLRTAAQITGFGEVHPQTKSLKVLKSRAYSGESRNSARTL
jgi:hypothetical protein